mmetsp:Transcript_3379/g.8844  ORF Transcript_3379/g.8844 Transcript_3379/m.8844 type:complete len:415 (+) Transcript_3379:59-1303(+)
MSPQTPVAMVVKKRGAGKTSPGKTPSPGGASGSGSAGNLQNLVQQPAGGAGRGALLASRTVKLLFLAALVTVTVLLLSRTTRPSQSNPFERRPTSTATSATSPSAEGSASSGEGAEADAGAAATPSTSSSSAASVDAGASPTQKPRERPPVVYSLSVVEEYDHDPGAFTQGFLHDRACDEATGACEDIFYESTGLYGETSVRQVDLKTGRVLRRRNAAARHFGEGLAKWGDELIQLTWQRPTTLVYNASGASLPLIREAKTDLKDGWGLTNDNASLIATDSGHTLYFLDPKNLTTTRKVDVLDGSQRVNYLNELEYVEGEVWANIWQTECIARIDPSTGKITGWILAYNVWHKEMVKSNALGLLHEMDVLNGIAYDGATKRLWITGKKWSTVYEVEVRVNENADLFNARQRCIV